MKPLAGLEKALAGLTRIDDVEVTAGLQGTAATGEATGGELVEIATAHEYGLGVPERPFMRTTVERRGMRWIAGWDRAVNAAMAGNLAEMANALRVTGVAMVGDIQAVINEGPWEANTEKTIASKTRAGRRGDQPLVDTGQMRQSIRAQVEVPGQTPVVVS